MSLSFIFSTFFLVLISAVAAKPQPRQVPWSTVAYGPDGPWPALQVRVGTPPVEVDLYPGGIFYSLIFTPELCDKPESSPRCLAREAGLYNIKQSTTGFNISSGGGTSGIRNETFHGTQSLHGDASFVFDTLTIGGSGGAKDAAVTNETFLALSRGFRTLPSGRTVSAAVGNLALGAPDTNMILGGFNGSIAPAFLFQRGDTPSYSFGLHTGSASLGIPGSLYFGGYDQSRIVGPVSVQQYDVGTRGTLPIELVDISIGVADDNAPSPFNFRSKTGLLARGNSSLSPSISVAIEPMEPYLYLPDSTCRAIAAELPVIFSADLGLYLWDTSNPLYAKIVSSPTAFLGFTFRANASITKNFDIKVPFRLLNLTLTDPLADRPTPYFPCSLPTLDTVDAPPFRLGRAFLQAAFIGVNWLSPGKAFFLAQAPGPGFSSPDVRSIQPSDASITASPDDWMATWQSGAFGTDSSPDAPPSSSSSPPTSKEGINVGVIAGSAAGGVLFIIVAIVTVCWCLRRRKRRSLTRSTTTTSSQLSDDSSKPLPDPYRRSNPYALGELTAMKSPKLLDSKRLTRWRPGHEPVEMPGSEVPECYYNRV